MMPDKARMEQMGLKLAVPSLAAQRVRLEPLSHAHSAGMFAMWSRPEVCQFAGPVADFNGDPVPLPAIDASVSDRIIDFFVRSAAVGTGFRWALLDRSDGAFVGAVGFNALGTCSQIAYHMLPEFWGRGLMTEAALAAIDWLRGRTGSETVEALIEESNATSIRLALRLGMKATRESAGGANRYLMSLHEG
jgi:ribosomal-protein-alanine N-acetyltransferase